MLATPSYDRPAAPYVFSIAQSRHALHAAGIPTAYLLLHGNCHVDDARNSIVREFLESDCSELLFLDADVCWEPRDIVQLCRRDLDVVGGVYPFRRDGGEQMPVRLLDVRLPGPDGLLEVEGLPTGFLKIKRAVLERIAAASPMYFDKVYQTRLVFDRPDPDKDGTRWGGDIAFCNKWRALGGKIYADAELRLGHTGEVIVRDSLAAHIRRLGDGTLPYVVGRLREGTEDEGDYNEAFKYAANPYAADATVLALVVGVARKCRGPIIEMGSGLSSVLMGAVAPNERIYSFEHLEFHAAQTHLWCHQAGVENVAIYCAPLKDWWYDLGAYDLPRKFAFGFCDGPPRLYGTRMRFFDLVASRCEVIVVDDVKSDVTYLGKVSQWASDNARKFQLLGRAALITKE